MTTMLNAPQQGGAPILTDDDLAALLGRSGDGTGDAPVPTMQPPTASDGAAAAINGKVVDALFSDGANRNAWMAIRDVGWRKVSQASDSGAMAISIIAGVAMQTGRAPGLEDDAAQLIQSIVLW